MGRKFADLTGQRFGRLTVLEQDGWYVTPSNKHRTAKWKCLCECGNYKTVIGRALTANQIKSCGCFVKDVVKKQGIARRLPPEERFWNDYISIYKYGARRRKHEWNLNKDYVIYIATQNCHYCGASPSKNSREKKSYIRSCVAGNVFPDMVFAESKVFYTNGIDRVNNFRGYEPDNVVACCAFCNFSKGSMSADEWNSWLDRLVAHRTKKSD